VVSASISSYKKTTDIINENLLDPFSKSFWGKSTAFQFLVDIPSKVARIPTGLARSKSFIDHSVSYWRFGKEESLPRQNPETQDSPEVQIGLRFISLNQLLFQQ